MSKGSIHIAIGLTVVAVIAFVSAVAVLIYAYN